MTTRPPTSLDIATARANELVSAGVGNHPIPPITDPLGSHWDQPARREIVIDDKTALMSKATFDKLHEYSATRPTGAYPGKMWKRFDGVYDRAFRAQGGIPNWLLCWYGPCIKPECPGCDKFCSNYFREIVLTDGELPTMEQPKTRPHLDDNRDRESILERG